jgi:hypothetical protein
MTEKPVSTRHRWGEKVRFGNYKSEQQCIRCELVKVSRHESEGARDVHWKEYWRDEDLISRDQMPICDFRCEAVPA